MTVNPIDEASRLAGMAEQQERVKNYKGAEELSTQASQYYLEALAKLKQKPQVDLDSLKTLELLAETHRRKSKMLALR